MRWRLLLPILLVLASALPARAQNALIGYLAFGTAYGSWLELSGAGYARQPITLQPAPGDYVNAGPATFTAGSTWSAGTEHGIYDSPTGGNLIAWWQLRIPIVFAVGATKTSAPRAIRIALQAPLNDGTGPTRQWTPGTQIGKTDPDGSPVYAGVALAVGNGVLTAFGPASIGAAAASASARSYAGHVESNVGMEGDGSSFATSQIAYLSQYCKLATNPIVDPQIVLDNFTGEAAIGGGPETGFATLVPAETSPISPACCTAAIVRLDVPERLERQRHQPDQPSRAAGG